MNQPNLTHAIAPSAISTSRNFDSWLHQQKISLAFTTYQTNRLFLIGLKPDGRLSVFDRTFERPMGLFATSERLVMSTRYQIWQFHNLCREEVGDYLEYDKLYVPRIGCTTGDINTHEIIVDNSQNWLFINTQFSCLATLDRDYSFRPIWQPPFISSLAAEDRCHLNGLAMLDGEPAFVTACSQTDIPAGWRSHRQGGGCVIDIRSNEIICSGLTMPHSPRFYQNKLWLLNSGTGELGYVENGQFQPITFCPGFARGLAFHGNYAIVGLSKPRHDNFQGLTLDERLYAQQQQAQCGLMVIDLTTGNILHWLIFEEIVKELFDIAVLPGVRQPMALGFATDEIERLVIFPGSKRIVSIRPGIHQPPETPVKIIEAAQTVGAAPRGCPPAAEAAEPVGAAPGGSPPPAEAAAAFHRGRELQKQGKLEEAAACFREAISRDRNYIPAYNNLGNLLQLQGKTLEAIATYQKALQINPNLAVAHCNLASARQLIGEIEPAIASYREALRLQPDFFLAHHNLGKLLAGQGFLLEAESCYQQALNLQPNSAQLYLDCGHLREQQGRWKEAIACFQQAIRCQPDFAAAYISIASVLQAHGLEEQALANYQRAIQLAPNSAQAHFKLGELYNAREQFTEALAHYEQALAIEPEATNVFYSLSYLRVQMCDWKDYRSRIQELIRRTETHIRTNKSAFLPPLMLSSFPIPLSLHAEVGRHYGKLVKKFAGCDDFKKTTKSDRHPKKLRVGYISPDFRTHPVGILLHQLFQNHDRSSFEIYAYSLIDVKDNFRQSIEAGCDNFVDLSEMSTLAAAQRIQTDGIDILVDLAGYTTYSRPDILALQPAPVQCSYLGYPDMTAAEFIQYLLADTWLISEEFSRHCPEKIVFLPHYFAASEVEISSQPVSRQQFGLPAEGIVFCCFNYPRKIDPNVFEVWMRILQQVPESVLWLYDGKSSLVVENLRRQATACGIAPERLVFASNQPLSEYLARYQLADLFLDTFIYNGGATAIGALQAGVPVLTLPGDSFAARMGASICAAAGLEEMICHSSEEYEQRAVYLATHPEELAAIRCKLKENRRSAPLFDMPQLARNLEAAFRQMWAESMNFDNAIALGTASVSFPEEKPESPAKVPQVSLVMTAYNTAAYIEGAIASVLAQTYPDWELIIWDDGSSDETASIARSYAERDSRIRFYSEAHRGYSHALNSSFALTRGNYLGCVDSDDILAPSALEETAAILEANPDLGVVYTNCIDLDPLGNEIGLNRRCQIPYSPERLLVDFMTFHFRLMRREVFETVGGFDRTFNSAPDYDLCLRLSEVTQFYHLAKPLYYYRCHPQQMTQSRRQELLEYSYLAINRALQRRGLAERYVLEVEEGSNKRYLRSLSRSTDAGSANLFPVKYQAIYNLTPDNLAPYDNFTFPSLQKHWQTHPQRGELIGISATIDNQMVGMVISEIIPQTHNQPYASILSCYVVPNYRDRRIGTTLISNLEKELIKFQCQQIEISYRSSQLTERALEPLLKKLGWLPPETTFILAQTTTQKIALAPWLHKYPLPKTLEIFPWGELTAAEKRQILTRQDYPTPLTPFSDETRIEPLNSLGLRYNGEVIGWMITHRVAPDTIRYSSLFVRQPYQKFGRAIPLLSESIKQQIDSKIENGTFSVAAENQLMLRFLERHLRPYLTGIGISRRAVKPLPLHYTSAKP